MLYLKYRKSDGYVVFSTDKIEDIVTDENFNIHDAGEFDFSGKTNIRVVDDAIIYDTLPIQPPSIEDRLKSLEDARLADMGLG